MSKSSNSMTRRMKLQTVLMLEQAVREHPDLGPMLVEAPKPAAGSSVSFGVDPGWWTGTGPNK